MTAHPDPHAIPDESVLRPYRFRPEVLHDESARIRSEARLDQILATPPNRVPQTVDVPRRRPSRRAVVARWAAVPVAAALIVGAGVVLPSDGVTLPGGITLPGLRGPQPAFASWTPDPSPVPPSDLVRAEAACRAVAVADALEGQREALLREIAAAEAALAEQAAAAAAAAEQARAAAAALAAAEGAGSERFAAAVAEAEARRAEAESQVVTAVTADGEEQVLATVTPRQELVAAEQRGTWPVLVFDGAESRDFCLLEDGDGSQPRVAAFTSIGNPTAAVEAPVSQYMVFTAGDGVDEPDVTSVTIARPRSVPADGIVLSTSLSTGVQGEGGLTLMDGYAGGDVVGVVVHTGNGEDVVATVSGGRFVAWWPTSAAVASYTLTLRDGTVLREVQLSR